MERFILFLLFILFPVSLLAQQNTEYNRKGDEAMGKKDYYDARFWYGEGVRDCNMYSIKQLTTIWLENESMRSSMRNIMSRCLTCLNVAATENDLEAMSQLIVFFREGIGGSKSEDLAVHWEGQKRALEKPVVEVPPITTSPIVTPQTPRNPMKFFVGYSFSTEMPYGLTVGGMKNNLGWYARVKTNFSFTSSSNLECKLNKSGEEPKTEIIGPVTSGKTYSVDSSKSNKKSSIAGTAGFIYSAAPWLNLSVGAGYGERTLITPFVVTDNDTSQKEEIWCKNKTYSYKGVMVEADAMFRMDRFFFSIGCHSVNFKYVDMNAGIGIFF